MVPVPSEDDWPSGGAETGGRGMDGTPSEAVRACSDEAVVVVDVAALYAADGTAKLARLPEYEAVVLERAGSGKVVKLTGPGPVWLYLRLAHVLHGRARKLIYDSPVTGEVVIFDHDPH